jgi:spore coat polysaccharide biosynthesis predicted glycosyltransferase SpsG
MTHLAICCDVGPKQRPDRLLRCLALAEELDSRGATVAFVCDANTTEWTQLQLRARGIEWTPPANTADEFVSLLGRLEVDAAVFDSSDLVGDVCATVRKAGFPTLAVVDGDADDAEADVVVDPNVEAQESRPGRRDGSTVLVGLDYAPMRNDVLANRPVSPPRRDGVEVPRVTALFDEESSASAAGAVARVLAETGRPFEATFVVSDHEAREAVGAVRPAPRQRIDVAEPSWRLYDRLARSDVVLGDAGRTTYEWLCMGASLGLVWVSDDQVDRYRRLMVRRAVIGLGSAQDLAVGPVSGVEKMMRLLSDARERARLAESGWRLVDGLGRARVADALLDLLGQARAGSS